MVTYIEAASAPLRNDGQIKLYGPADFAAMRRAGRLVAECLDAVEEIVEPGLPTIEIDRFIYDFAMRHGAMPATLGYKGYTNSTCVSVNHVVCHGIPADKPLRDGDIANIDVTLIVDGWHGDSSRMVKVGEVKRAAERLVEITYAAMMRGISVIRPGITTSEIGYAIQEYAERERCSVVRDFCGHGVGRLFHDVPNILHYGESYNSDDARREAVARGRATELKPGMIFTVEPMINLGRPHVKVLADGWTAVTRDRSLSAQFEHTVGVTETGHEIFTLSPKHGETERIRA